MASDEESNDCKWVVFQYFTKFDFTYWNQTKPLTFIVKYLTRVLQKALSVFAGFLQFSVGYRADKTWNLPYFLTTMAYDENRNPSHSSFWAMVWQWTFLLTLADMVKVPAMGRMGCVSAPTCQGPSHLTAPESKGYIWLWLPFFPSFYALKLMIDSLWFHILPQYWGVQTLTAWADKTVCARL